MRVLIASSEVFPFSKTGGLADMVGALGKALAAAGVDTQIITPLYRGIPEARPEIEKTDFVFDLPLGHDRIRGGLRRLGLAPHLDILFVEHCDFFERDGIYGGAGWDYPDNGLRYLFFDKCVTNYAHYSAFQPDLIHLNDWHTGLIPWMSEQAAQERGLPRGPATILTIHNLAHQGIYPRDLYPLSNLPWELFAHETIEFFGSINFLKAAITGCDQVSTVSPTYAKEIQTSEYGCGLEGALKARGDELIGILNGVDYEEWNTTHNPHLNFKYSATNPKGKIFEKRRLQLELGLEPRAGTPLLATVSRLAEQKGIDFLAEALESLLAGGANFQFALLGSGDPVMEARFERLANERPGQVATVIGYDHSLAHRIEAGADFFVMPSRFEPCGLNQMYSLRYGTIPIVRATGGLQDTVIDTSDSFQRANGLKFGKANAAELKKALTLALELYANKPLLKHFRLNGMLADYSWDASATRYVQVFSDLVEANRAHIEASAAPLAEEHAPQ